MQNLTSASIKSEEQKLAYKPHQKKIKKKINKDKGIYTKFRIRQSTIYTKNEQTESHPDFIPIRGPPPTKKCAWTLYWIGSTITPKVTKFPQRFTLGGPGATYSRFTTTVGACEQLERTRYPTSPKRKTHFEQDPRRRRQGPS